MAAIHRILKDNNAKGLTRILLKITDGRDYQIKISTGLSVNPKHWNKNKKYVLSADQHSTAKNSHIKEFEEKILKLYLEAKAQNIKPNTNYFNEKIKAIEIKSSPQENSNVTFWELYNQYLNFKKSSFTVASHKKISGFINHLKDFEKDKNINLEINEINDWLLSELQSYFYEVKKLNTQTTSKYIGVFRMFLNWALDNGFTVNTKFRKFKPILQPSTEKAIFSQSDLDLLRGLDSKAKPYLRNVSDLLILSCLTGLRYSDYSRLKPEHIKLDNYGNKFISIKQTKTNDNVKIPLSQEAERILNKLFSGTIHPISNQKMNTYAKELCELVGIDEPFEIYRYVGKEKKAETVPKYKVISTHTGRRTFATNLLLKGVPAEIVMEFTGHKDYKSFKEYVNIPDETKMDLVRKALLA